MLVSEIDRQIGIETFATATKGIGGAIKREVEDFVVEEVLVDGSRAHTENSDARPPLGSSQESQRFLRGRSLVWGLDLPLPKESTD